MICEIFEPALVAPLFKDWQETMIYSCLQQIMGHLYANDPKTPAAAMAIVGDFCFLAGVPDPELVLYQSEISGQKSMLLVPQNDAWAHLIEQSFGNEAQKTVRYAIKKEKDIFDISFLQQLTENVPAGFNLKPLDAELFERCRAQAWCRDWVSNFTDFAMYEKYGLGMVLLEGDEIVAGASSYARYRDGIEIQIDTKENYRRQGLAAICGAKLILECLRRGLYPSWDAQNKQSLALAKKLGYHFDHEYEVYEVKWRI